MSDLPNVSEQERLESSAEGRQRRCRRNLRWQAVPHLRTSDRKCSAANSGAVNRRLDEAVAAGRAKSSATWKVGNVGERARYDCAQPWRTLYRVAKKVSHYQESSLNRI